MDVSALEAVLPLSVPTPNAVSHASLIPAEDLTTEYELARNGQNLHAWQSYIKHVKEQNHRQEMDARGTATKQQESALGKKLATQPGRESYQRIIDVYERALAHFPTSYKLWKAYLDARSAYILGIPAKKLNLAATKKKRDIEAGSILQDLKGLEQDDHDRDVAQLYEGGLNGTIGHIEWRALAACFERALTCNPRMPRLWLNYLNMLRQPLCPAYLSHTHARRTFDRALRTLPGSLHERVWRLYLRWATAIGGETLVKVFRRYLRVDPLPTEHYVSVLLEQGPERSLEAAKLLLSLSRRAAKGQYKSPEVKSSYDLLGQFLEVCVNHADEVGLDEADATAIASTESAGGAARHMLAQGNAAAAEHDTATNGTAMQVDGDQPVNGLAVYDADVDPASVSKLDVEAIVRHDGLAAYKDQAGTLWAGLATYWIRKGDLDHARQIFEEGLATVLTIRDFTQIFDAYAEFSETYISSLMDAIANPPEDEEDVLGPEDEEELDQRMQDFESLMDRRPFLVNEVLIRRNPNDIQEWEKRVALHGTDDSKVDETYRRAIDTINPRKAVGGFHHIFISYAKFFEEGGVAASAADRSESDLASARQVFERAIAVPFRKVDELAEIWCEWAEMEVRNENYDEALRIMQRATALPRRTKVNFHDETLTAQQRLFKSLKLWSFYVDLEESIGSVESTKEVYDKIFELKIANAQIVINFANFLEENSYFEDSFKVYERGVDLFTYPVVFEIWNTYLTKFIRRYGGEKIERARDLFEQALDGCPSKFVKPLYLLYGQLEEEHGLAKRAMSVYERATQAVDAKDRFTMYEVLIAKATANFGMPATRSIYEKALEALPDAETATMCLRFAGLEKKLGEIDRARAIYAHGSQFCDPRVNPEFWSDWNSFEISHGSEDTFREMLRIKRAVQASFNTEASYIAARAANARKGNVQSADATDAVRGAADPMAQLDNAAGQQPAFVP
ncbi:uncharacterized protein L969DRAFT_45779 [Mixia osmundae IAM 14324]|nr:uncharacterized protein L969DRAFT_45779 [Mixia osmundae IAM 14324]KEI41587.1 hypothetical protein L969DRAFT_45779 [Mixia osmundae IAM 14324]